MGELINLGQAMDFFGMQPEGCLQQAALGSNRERTQSDSNYRRQRKQIRHRSGLLAYRVHAMRFAPTRKIRLC
jgi:hypothetical protein